DRKKQKINRAVKTKATGIIASFRKSLSAESLSEVFSALDKAAKGRVFHPKKADRLKSRLAKLLAKKK
ncbi:30S ribosomal protein S20, partial [Candidatus Collierbacteria bacterium]|nr:30S ribosomal protein S20 [Candidatus Collierbacteria bacterium]